MKPITFKVFSLFLLSLFMFSCQQKPRVILPEAMENIESAGDISNAIDMPIVSEGNTNEHKVTVEEILDTEKYTYLFVSEAGEKFWIAIPRKKVEIGGTYYYTGGLLKRNFESKEYNRIFETIYLVSDVTPNPINSNSNVGAGQDTKNPESVDIAPAKGSIKLSELFSNPEKYENKVVQITGNCVKVNPMIMGRNWIHIQDGSGDGLDLTVTSSEIISINSFVTLEGVIALNKDFGAGYKYDVIMEKAILK